MDSVVIVGPGAMGLLFAFRLAKAGTAVCLLDHRADRAEALRRRGIRLSSPDEPIDMATVPVYVRADEIGNERDVDVVLFCVKAYATKSAATHADALRRADPVVVTLQNGIGNAETLADRFGEARVLVGATAEGATRVSDNEVRHAGRGSTWIGSVRPAGMDDARGFCALMTNAGFDARTTDDWRATIWAKAIINAAINPVAALVQAPNGRLAESASTVIAGVAREGQTVARGLGLNVPDDLPEAALRICRATSGNRASMLQDLDHGRRTELEFINDVLLREAERRGIDTPTMRTVTELARARECAALTAHGGR